MTHSEAISVLLDTLSRPPLERPPPEVRRRAETHAADCSDCWEMTRLLHEIATGSDPPEAERMPALYGCEAVQDDLYLLADLAPRQMRARNPAAVRHLIWCHACRELFVEVIHVERAAARGAFGPPIAEGAGAEWRALPSAVGRTVRELVGRLVVEVRQGALVFVTVPTGLALVPQPPEVAWRGADAVADDPSACRGGRLRFALAESGLSAELSLEPRGPARVELALRVDGGSSGALAIALRAVGADRLALIAVETVHGDEAAVIRDVPAGKYLLELERKPEQERFRMALTIASLPTG